MTGSTHAASEAVWLGWLRNSIGGGHSCMPGWRGWIEAKVLPRQGFDGQHKATAQVLLRVRALPIRVFVDPDPDLLLTTNTNAGTTLRQVAFDKSVQT